MEKTLFPIAHRDDPVTSYEAGEKMVRSGALNDQEFEVYQAIRNYPGRDFTARELSKHSGINYYTIQRRLSGLERAWKIKRVQWREMLTPNKYVLRYDKRDGCTVWKLRERK